MTIVVGLELGSDFLGKMGRDEISVLEEELVQLSMKSLLIFLSTNPTLLCLVWTRNSYNSDSFCAQLKTIWKTENLRFRRQDRTYF